MTYETRQLDYELPPGQIAQVPLENREESRLLTLRRDTGEIKHRVFKDIVGYARPGDLFVVNDSRVFPARLFVKKKTGARVELLFLSPSDEAAGLWKVLARPGRRLREGTELYHDALEAPFGRLAAKHESGVCVLEVGPKPLWPFLAGHGIVPLPPYIKKPIDNPERYQTVYAERNGSAAAPTAGLHFTRPLIEEIKSAGAGFARVTLHIGLDTFRPISAERIEDHEMHSEMYVVPDDAAAAVALTIRGGGRVVAVGTTAVRALESWAAGRDRGTIASGVPGGAGETRLFIYAGSQFKVVDALVTNFHLPRSTLLALVGAFAGLDNVMRAYHEAIERGYRFYSFGDAMFIF